jgi:CDP-glucose 4,6-dehydratase
MEDLAMTPGMVDPAFWRGRRVLLTGHTGFKGGWCALWLSAMGAKVHGLALAPDTDPNLHQLTRVDEAVPGTLADIRDRAAVAAVVREARPQIVLHMAAQPLVRRSLREPLPTFDTNVMGTANLLEALRDSADLQAVLVVTTDKVYENPEGGTPFREHDPLGGHDPYSASKAAAEIVVSSYRRTFFEPSGIPLATARGGNVIGGGDFSEDRIVPDIWRSLRRGDPIVLRNPAATRPWQHVLDCLNGYLLYAQALATGGHVPPSLNFGPLSDAQVPVSRLAEAMLEAMGERPDWEAASGPQPREMQSLALDCRAAAATLGFSDRLIGRSAIEATAAWYLAYERGEDMRRHTLREIEDFQRT